MFDQQAAYSDKAVHHHGGRTWACVGEVQGVGAACCVWQHGQDATHCCEALQQAHRLAPVFAAAGGCTSARQDCLLLLLLSGWDDAHPCTCRRASPPRPHPLVGEGSSWCPASIHLYHGMVHPAWTDHLLPDVVGCAAPGELPAATAYGISTEASSHIINLFARVMVTCCSPGHVGDPPHPEAPPMSAGVPGQGGKGEPCSKLRTDSKVLTGRAGASPSSAMMLLLLCPTTGALDVYVKPGCVKL